MNDQNTPGFNPSATEQIEFLYKKVAQLISSNILMLSYSQEHFWLKAKVAQKT